MKTFLKKMLIIILIICILPLSVAGTAVNSYATTDSSTGYLTQERAGNFIAEFAINFYDNYNSETEYLAEGDYETARQLAYQGQKYNGKYTMDCVGFVSFAIRQSLGIGNEDFTYFVTPYVTAGGQATNGFEWIVQDANGIDINSLNPGDILVRSRADSESRGGHVLIYVGGGKVVHCTGHGDNGALQYQNVSELTYTIGAVARISKETAESIPVSQATNMFNGKGMSTASQFTYSGIPTEGTYLGTSSAFDWVIDVVKQIFEYLLGILTLGLKIQLIGWSSIAEKIIQDVITFGTEDEEAASSVDPIQGPSATSDTSKNRVTYEDMIFNRVPILDVNFTNLTTAGGSKIEDGNIVYTLRTNIAAIYYIIRNISIMILLLILIYIGIRLAIASTGEKKAEYKKMLVDWVVAFIIVFCIHYFMIAIFNINEELVDFFSNLNTQVTDGGESLYETVRTKAYSLKFSEGMAGTVIYMYLVFLLIKFLFVYYKRYFTVTVLALLAPVLGIRFALEKIKSKKVTSLGNWMYEFALNVFIQPVQALVYIVFMSIVVNIAFESIPGFVLALILLNFILKADGIFMKIFNFDRAKSVGDTTKREAITDKFNGIRDVTFLGFGVFHLGKKFAGKAFDNFQAVRRDYLDVYTGKDTKKIDEMNKYKRIGNWYQLVENEYPQGKKGKRGEDWEALVHAYSQLGQIDDLETNRKLYQAIKGYKKLRKEITYSSAKSVLTMAKGAATMGLAIPAIIANPAVGIGTMEQGISDIKSQGSAQSKYRGKSGQLELERRRSEKYGKTSKFVQEAAKITDAINLGSMPYLSGKLSQIQLERFDKMKDLEKSLGKVKTLGQADSIEKDIEKLYNEIISLTKAKNANLSDEEVKLMANKQLDRTVSETMKKSVSKSTVKEAVDDYIYSKGIADVTSSDVDGVMKNLEQMLSDDGSKIQFTSSTKANIKKSLENAVKKNNNKGIDSDKAIEAVRNGLAEKGSIKDNVTTGIRDNDLKEKYEDLGEKIRKYKVLYDNKYGAAIDSPKKLEQRIIKRSDKGNNK